MEEKCLRSSTFDEEPQPFHSSTGQHVDQRHYPGSSGTSAGYSGSDDGFRTPDSTIKTISSRRSSCVVQSKANPRARSGASDLFVSPENSSSSISKVNAHRDSERGRRKECRDCFLLLEELIPEPIAETIHSRTNVGKMAKNERLKIVISSMHVKDSQLAENCRTIDVLHKVEEHYLDLCERLSSLEPGWKLCTSEHCTNLTDPATQKTHCTQCHVKNSSCDKYRQSFKNSEANISLLEEDLKHRFNLDMRFAKPGVVGPLPSSSHPSSSSKGITGGARSSNKRQKK